MSEAFQCIICRHDVYTVQSEKVRDSKENQVVCCVRCGHTQLYPMPHVIENQAFYDHDSQSKQVNIGLDFNLIEEKARADTQRRVQMLQAIASKDAKIMDIGCGYGFFVRSMQELGFDAEGMEIGKERRRVAQAACQNRIYGYDLLCDEIPLELNCSYDVVTLFHVLEHIIDPVLFLQKVLQLLKPQGRIIIEVPNVQDHLLTISNEYKQFYWQRAHLSYFNASLLMQVLEKAGYMLPSVHGVQRYSFLNMAHWVINQRPQINSPSYEVEPNLSWMNQYYQKTLVQNLQCDTIIATAIPK